MIDVSFDTELTNEFARVRVARDDDANGPRLRITSRRTGDTVWLDPLMLESLTWQPEETFAGFLATPFGPAAEEATP